MEYLYHVTKNKQIHDTSEVFCIILVHVEVLLLILHIAVVLGPPSVCCPKKAVDFRSVLATEFLERAVIFDQPSGGRVGHGYLVENWWKLGYGILPSKDSKHRKTCRRYFFGRCAWGDGTSTKIRDIQ